MNHRQLHEATSLQSANRNVPFRVVTEDPRGRVTGELMRQIIAKEGMSLEASKILEAYAYDKESDIFQLKNQIPTVDPPLVIPDNDFVDLSEQEDFL